MSSRPASDNPFSSSSSLRAPPPPSPLPEHPAASRFFSSSSSSSSHTAAATQPTQRVPGRLVELSGDLVQAALNKEISYIAHQCNCVTLRARGLAEAIFGTFPSADIYKNRKEAVKAGSIIIRGKVINMLAQVYPGPPTTSESEAMRMHWFRACLEKMKEELDPGTTNSVAFPYKIGCGLAKGYWPHYHQALKEFAETVPYYVYVIKVRGKERRVERCFLWGKSTFSSDPFSFSLLSPPHSNSRLTLAGRPARGHAQESG